MKKTTLINGVFNLGLIGILVAVWLTPWGYAAKVFHTSMWLMTVTVFTGVSYVLAEKNKEKAKAKKGVEDFMKDLMKDLKPGKGGKKK